MISRVLIVDGYTDEPAGLGVPPYIDVYPRYVAGAFWSIDKSIRVDYVTVDEARRDVHGFIRRANTYDIVFVIAGAVVPGRYIGGAPITLDELQSWFTAITKPFKVLAGAAARWGIGNEGGTVAALPREVRSAFDAVVTGEPEAYAYHLALEGPEKAPTWARLVDENERRLVDRFAILGAKIVDQHPNYGYNLVAEIETFRGCPRWVVGGCSFCVTKLYGRPWCRPPESIVKEVEALYRYGVRHFRLGRQADILVYGAEKIDSEEWPVPNPSMLEKLFYGIRAVAPSLHTLHIDNVNPGTIAKHPRESEEALKVIVKYHTPGDVAALGIETADPTVVVKNNLKVMPDEALEAIRVINRVGAIRGYNGLPELLPGINFVLGLIGETRDTYRRNLEFLKKVYEEGLYVRRINVRQVLVLPGTLMWRYGTKFLDKHRSLARWFREQAMKFSRAFLYRMLPPGSILRFLYVEGFDERNRMTIARQAGTYPLVAEIPCKLPKPLVVDVAVYGYTGRSVRALPVPLDANRAPFSVLAKLFGPQLAGRIVGLRPYRSDADIRAKLGPNLSRYLSVKGYTCEAS
jgi:radical SAM superfamily enzyme with C-terminal helix-hairpin-helix motif